MIDQATKEKILDAVRIEEVIGDFVSLRRRGANYLGLCPFHQDKNPSMSVSSTKGIFKCFACGKSGTAVSFIMEHEHMSFPDALKYLAKKYHIEVVEKEESAEDVASRMRRESLLVVSEYAQKYYENILWNTEVGKAIGLSYFRERKFSDETIRKFGLGYASSRPLTLSSQALKEGYKAEYLVDAGLCLRRENSQEIYDRFFDRVMFPIHSLSGRVVAFGGRTLKTDKSVAKYVNSPETEIYIKRQNLYGLFQAKSAIVKNSKCILVEGYADVISMHQSGIENVVASSGTSLTVEQIRLIKRFTENVTVIYDGDAAGIKAALRGIDLILEEGLKVKVVLLPPEDDPDSFAKAHTRTEILEFIEENEKDFISFKMDILSRGTANDPFERARVIDDIIQSVSVIPDPILRNICADMVADKFDQKSETVLHKISTMRKKKRELARSRQAVENRPREDVPPPAEPYEYGEELQPAPEAQPRREAAVMDSYLAVPEKELIYYLIKFGEYMFVPERDVAYGSAPQEELTVAEYIRNSLDEDEVVFTCDIFRRIYDLYYGFAASLPAGEDSAARQERIQRYFSTHEDQAVTAQTLDIICEQHPVTVKTFRESIMPEHLQLSAVVPKAVYIYKYRIVDLSCTALTKEIMQMQRDGGDEETLKQAVERLQLLNTIKKQLAKSSKRL